MSFEPRESDNDNNDILETSDRRTGLLIGLAVIGLMIMVAGLLFFVSPARTIILRRGDSEDELDLEVETLESDAG